MSENVNIIYLKKSKILFDSHPANPTVAITQPAIYTFLKNPIVGFSSSIK